MKRAYELGYYEPGWTVEELIQARIEGHGWINGMFNGEKGGGKTNLMAQHIKSVYGSWDTAVQNMFFGPVTFARRLKEAIECRETIPCAGYDDITTHLPKSLYFTHREVWHLIKTKWPHFREIMSVFFSTCPRKDDVISVILNDMNLDLFVTNRRFYQVNLWCQDVDPFKRTRVREFNVILRKEQFNLHDVPADVWQMIWEKKMIEVRQGVLDLAHVLESISEKPSEKPAPSMDEASQAGRMLSAKHWGRKKAAVDAVSRLTAPTPSPEPPTV